MLVPADPGTIQSRVNKIVETAFLFPEGIRGRVDQLEAYSRSLAEGDSSVEPLLSSLLVAFEAIDFRGQSNIEVLRFRILQGNRQEALRALGEVVALGESAAPLATLLGDIITGGVEVVHYGGHLREMRNQALQALQSIGSAALPTLTKVASYDAEHCWDDYNNTVQMIQSFGEAAVSHLKDLAKTTAHRANNLLPLIDALSQIEGANSIAALKTVRSQVYHPLSFIGEALARVGINAFKDRKARLKKQPLVGIRAAVALARLTGKKVGQDGAFWAGLSAACIDGHFCQLSTVAKELQKNPDLFTANDSQRILNNFAAALDRNYLLLNQKIAKCHEALQSTWKRVVRRRGEINTDLRSYDQVKTNLMAVFDEVTAHLSPITPPAAINLGGLLGFSPKAAPLSWLLSYTLLANCEPKAALSDKTLRDVAKLPVDDHISLRLTLLYRALTNKLKSGEEFERALDQFLVRLPFVGPDDQQLKQGDSAPLDETGLERAGVRYWEMLRDGVLTQAVVCSGISRLGSVAAQKFCDSIRPDEADSVERAFRVISSLRRNYPHIEFKFDQAEAGKMISSVGFPTQTVREVLNALAP